MSLTAQLDIFFGEDEDGKNTYLFKSVRDMFSRIPNTQNFSYFLLKQGRIRLLRSKNVCTYL